MVNPLYQKNIISINDLTREDLELALQVAASLKARPQPELLKHKVIASCFFEASTRTRLSFETAMHRLGASVVGFADSIANRLKNDYSRSPDMWQRSIAGCYQNNVAWL